ncbi:hypothetical protein KBB96_00980 [Luteolibacter ambystomatis]|uniref:Uncharacterized protein n=1 Tax=Luteolibacter ambystomatis TaxID=2824561 RepID=A0A975G9V6_9BACT|nr:hypothetical protein [Luteolibacter ambystomatis]QUE51486.1 hypothetical protein KBB96_00980 [Luteolibacter ambystomatis]
MPLIHSYTLVWPDGFDEDGCLIESKGWFNGLEIHIGDNRFRPVFYDPVRLSQEISDELLRDGIFSEPGLIVIASVTRMNIEAAIARMAESGELSRLFFNPDRPPE